MNKIIPQGYTLNNTYLRSNRGEKKYIHREVMERFLNRKLLRDEQVHHINGDHFDNRIENLKVMSNKEHQRLHVLEKNINLTCYSCKKQFMAMDKPFYKIRYCSSKCGKRGRRQGLVSKANCWNK